MSNQSREFFCFGLGYTGQALCRRLGPQGWGLAGTTREPAEAERLAAAGIDCFVFADGSPLEDAALGRLQGASHVLSTVPPDADGDPVLRTDAEALSRCPNLAWLGYLSTTNVYGDRGGDWVDEAMAPAPNTERGRRRTRAEVDWRRLAEEAGLPLHIFRLAGIYGPGRNQLETVRQGRAKRIDKPGQVFSRIHIDDLVTVLEASMQAPGPGAVYNVADDEAAPPAQVIAYAAELLGLPPPPLEPFETADLSPMARSFYAESKRVRNDRIKRELGIRLAYPSYREGLKALLDD
ncbi:MAG: SDR family oxidoreductase [Alphaproteobacteria bacterium]|jgi:nucleoside-diphosphate-sugar epimerase|nr:SDR family oxidoreductase [Alphaproteobacteria bacterium]